MGHVGGLSAFASDVERIAVNQTSPDPALGDDRSEYLGGANPHPFLTFTPIPQAMSMSIDRARIAEQLYGFSGRRPHAILSWPPRGILPPPTTDACPRISKAPERCWTMLACWTPTGTAFGSTGASP